MRELKLQKVAGKFARDANASQCEIGSARLIARFCICMRARRDIRHLLMSFVCMRVHHLTTANCGEHCSGMHIRHARTHSHEPTRMPEITAHTRTFYCMSTRVVSSEKQPTGTICILHVSMAELSVCWMSSSLPHYGRIV